TEESGARPLPVAREQLRLHLGERAQDSPFAEWAAASGGGQRRGNTERKARKEEGEKEESYLTGLKENNGVEST
ncbi:unnamed protein product, partial [Pleuronectes platessa]